MSPSVAALCMLLAQTPADAPSQPRIYGGEPVPGAELAQVVAVVIQPNYLCTGTVVASRVVLTAAHCLQSAPAPADILVVIGPSLAQPLEVLTVERWGAHPDHCQDDPDDCQARFDFAYLVLDQPVVFDDGYIVPFATQQDIDETMKPGQPVWLVGFGADGEGTEGSGIKRKVLSEIREFRDDGREFLAGGDGKDSCLGDSGGPALIDIDGHMRLAGVLSVGFECGKGSIYGIPYPALCWLRAETGVDLAQGCEACDCVVLPEPHEDGCGCTTADAGSGWLLTLVAAWRRRRAAPVQPHRRHLPAGPGRESAPSFPLA